MLCVSLARQCMHVRMLKNQLDELAEALPQARNSAGNSWEPISCKHVFMRYSDLFSGSDRHVAACVGLVIELTVYRCLARCFASFGKGSLGLMFAMPAVVVDASGSSNRVVLAAVLAAMAQAVSLGQEDVSC